VVAGSGALASGMVAAGGRSGVPVLGLFAAGGAAVGLPRAFGSQTYVAHNTGHVVPPVYLSTVCGLSIPAFANH
jgi:hypothetical protein